MWQRLAPGVPLVYYWQNDEWSQLRIRPYKNLGRWRTAEITSAWCMPFAPHSSFCCRFQLRLLFCSRFHQAWARSICVSACQWVPLWNLLFFVPQYSVTESYTLKTCFLVLWLAFWNCTRVWIMIIRNTKFQPQISANYLDGILNFIWFPWKLKLVTLQSFLLKRWLSLLFTTSKNVSDHREKLSLLRLGPRSKNTLKSYLSILITELTNVKSVRQWNKNLWLW